MTVMVLPSLDEGGMIDQRLRSLVKGRSLGGFVAVFSFALAARTQGLAGCWIFRSVEEGYDRPVDLEVAKRSGGSGDLRFSARHERHHEIQTVTLIAAGFGSYRESHLEF